ncbi:MAG: glycine/D-amino acid oxidase-like deaminating enzyme, partial [Candidatus Paceibacteria bacterium]
MRARIVIVGGGVVGLSIALHAARRTDPLKEPVMLLDGDDVGVGPSARSGAVLGQFYGTKNTAGMARDSLRYYRGIEDKTGRSLGFVPTGVLTLAKSRTPKGLAKLRELVHMQDSIGIDVRCVDAAEMRVLINGLKVPDDALGAWEPTAGCLDPERTLDAFSSLARNRGAIIRSRTPVQRIVTENGRVVGVETPEGLIKCEQVVVAAGPWTCALLDPLGITLPICGVRAELGYLACTEEAMLSAELESAIAIPGPESSGATEYYSRAMMQGHHPAAQFDSQNDGSAPVLKAAHPVLTDPEQGFFIRSDPLNGRSIVGRRGRAGFEEIKDLDHIPESVGQDFSFWAREKVES